MASGIEELVGMLYDMVSDAWALPFGAEKCLLDRERALDLIDEIRANLPKDLERQRLSLKGVMIFWRRRSARRKRLNAQLKTVHGILSQRMKSCLQQNRKQMKWSRLLKPSQRSFHALRMSMWMILCAV